MIDGFLTSPYGLWYGEPFCQDEIPDATYWLGNQGYIRGITGSGQGYVRPSIAEKGDL